MQLIFSFRTALADITIGVSLPLTGPASGLGIAVNQQIMLHMAVAERGYKAKTYKPMPPPAT